MKQFCASLVAFCSLYLCACIPIPNVELYRKMTPPIDGREFHGGNNGRPGEPPTLIYYPYHDIFISVDSRSLWFGLHIPPGTTVNVNDSTIRLQGQTKNDFYDQSFPIRADQHASFSIPPHTFYPATDTASYGLGPLNGARERGALIWYRFSAYNPDIPKQLLLPTNLLKGTITVPSLTINGARYEPQSVPFERAFYMGFLQII
jgi:hypothetical protein